MPYTCVKPWATSRALNLLMLPCWSRLILNTHLQADEVGSGWLVHVAPGAGLSKRRQLIADGCEPVIAMRAVHGLLVCAWLFDVSVCGLPVQHERCRSSVVCQVQLADSVCLIVAWRL